MWAKTLWLNMNADALLDGMKSFIGEFRRFDDSVKQLPVGQFLDVHMKQFKNSVPIFVELKNESMRDRHWEELMVKTGVFVITYLTNSYKRLTTDVQETCSQLDVDFGMIVLNQLSHFASCAKRRQELGDFLLGLYVDSIWMTKSWQCGGSIYRKKLQNIGRNI